MKNKKRIDQAVTDLRRIVAAAGKFNSAPTEALQLVESAKAAGRDLTIGDWERVDRMIAAHPKS